LSKSVSFFLYVLFFSLVLYVPAHKTLAAENGFDFTMGSETFSITQSTLNSWQGEQIVEQSKVLPPPQKSFNTYVLVFLGNPLPKTAPVLIYHHRLDKVYEYLNDLAEKINVESQEPELEIADNSHVTKFIPPQTGVKMDIYKTALLSLRAMELGKDSLELTIYQTEPKNNLAETNSLGINELVAQGVSNFKGSPKNRRHNIAVGVEKFKGIIIPQGATFSFNDNLGPVDGEHGFLPELVIKATGTVPEFGGGLCQVSSTTFRAAMAAGLPITARKNHAYAVQYYAPQGTDATIYPGSADLKFVNDTPAAILIWPYEKDKDTLIFDFYGTKDSRQVTLEKPVQYDRKTDGSMKATWTRQVISANGVPRTDVFKSVYLPPALFHKEEKFVAAAPVLAPAITAPVQ